MADRKKTPATTIKPINTALEHLAKIREKEQEIRQEAETVILAIRDGLVEAVVVFIDMVDSTKYKITHERSPEKWILRVKQFSEIVAAYIEDANGRVVKFIGDEVMGMFNGPAAINDALNLINRIKEIETSLQTTTGEVTRVKVVIDWGKVFLVEYEGHRASDPQGTPVDRCARIGKHAQPGTVLSSYEFVQHCEDRTKWTELGSVDMKGLGEIKVYQHGSKTVDIVNMAQIDKESLRIKDETLARLSAENHALTAKYDEAVKKNKELQEKLKEVGERPAEESSIAAPGLEQEWEEFQKLVAAAKSALLPFPRIVTLALYHEFAGEGFFPEGSDEEAAARSKQDGLLVLKDSGWVTDEKSAKIRKANAALSKLQEFLSGRRSEAFFSDYEEANNDDRPELELRPFWKRHFGLKG